MITRNDFKSKLMSLNGKKGDMFFDYFGLKTDWCAIFVTYCMKEIAKISWFPKTASCGEIKRKLSQRLNHDYRTAEIGDIILFETNNPYDGPEHVGIVIGNSNNTITIAEGNTGHKDFTKSTVGIYRYSYSEVTFDCIIDMSPEFSEADELERYKTALNKIKAILSEV